MTHEAPLSSDIIRRPLRRYRADDGVPGLGCGNPARISRHIFAVLRRVLGGGVFGAVLLFGAGMTARVHFVEIIVGRTCPQKGSHEIH
jgi:hypothetical protein